MTANILPRPDLERLIQYELERGKKGLEYDATLISVCSYALALERQFAPYEGEEEA